MDKIAILNNDGLPVSAKLRSEISPQDVYHAVFLLLLTPSRQYIASTLAGNRLSATAVTMCREHESADQAAARMSALPLHHLGDQFYVSPEGRRQYMSVFYGSSRISDDATGYELLSAVDLDARRDDCTPALRFVLQSYRHLLPLA